MLTIVGDTQSVGRLLEQKKPKIPRSKADDSFSPSSLNLMLIFWLVSAMLCPFGSIFIIPNSHNSHDMKIIKPLGNGNSTIRNRWPRVGGFH